MNFWAKVLAFLKLQSFFLLGFWACVGQTFLLFLTSGWVPAGSSSCGLNLKNVSLGEVNSFVLAVRFLSPVFGSYCFESV